MHRVPKPSDNIQNECWSQMNTNDTHFIRQTTRTIPGFVTLTGEITAWANTANYLPHTAGPQLTLCG